ncbi:hypothetical protein CC2G_011610 [Coprinopsis cinerea AmutBmut pab1-1]|nr:hypothetical protein CC2G_011610 [Coprinopsis cinerea AmutBmut pab1-1]
MKFLDSLEFARSAGASLIDLGVAKGWIQTVLNALEIKDANIVHLIYEDTATLDAPGLGVITGSKDLKLFYGWLYASINKLDFAVKSAEVTATHLSFQVVFTSTLKDKDPVVIDVSYNAEKTPLGRVKYAKLGGDWTPLWRQCEAVSGPCPGLQKAATTN